MHSTLPMWVKLPSPMHLLFFSVVAAANNTCAGEQSKTKKYSIELDPRLQAEQKAADASAQAQEYYHKLTNSWTPHWLEQRLTHSSSWVSKTVLSDKSGKQNVVGQYLSLARVKLAAFWATTKVGFTAASLHSCGLAAHDKVMTVPCITWISEFEPSQQWGGKAVSAVELSALLACL